MGGAILISQKPCALVANEPRLYREAIADELRVLRPDLDVVVATSDDLRVLVHRLGPQIVFSSEGSWELTPPVRAWIALHSGRLPSVVIETPRGRSCYRDIALPEILSLIRSSLESSPT